MFLAFWVCVQKTFGNIFGIDSLTEIVFFKITRRVAGEKNGLSSVRNLMSELPYSTCVGCNLKEIEVI